LIRTADSSTTRRPAWEGFTVLSILLTMFVIVLMAGLIVLYVAYPHRGENMPHTPWVGEAMRKGVSMLPTLDNQSDEQKYQSRERVEQHQ
jgi:heme/copper-type cytochrome/quinol oxidase subunit 2